MTETQAPKGESRRRRTVILAAAVSVLALAVIVALVLTQQSQGTSAPPNPTETTGQTQPDETPAPTRTSPPPVTGPAASPSRASSGPNTPYRPELEPVEPDQPVEGEDGLLVALTSVEHVKGQALQPGEVSGPALRVTITLTNKTDAPLDSDLISVNAYSGKDRAPAGTVLKPGALPFEGTIGVGESTYAIYVFTIAPSQQDDVTITVDYRSEAAVVVFEGDLS